MQRIFNRLEIATVNNGACAKDWIECPETALVSVNPANESELAQVRMADRNAYERIVSEAQGTWKHWRLYPAPKRGQIIRAIADELRRFKDDLGALVTLETGKILAEGKGEVQEMIDIADFALGLSRQLYG